MLWKLGISLYSVHQAKGRLSYLLLSRTRYATTWSTNTNRLDLEETSQDGFTNQSNMLIKQVMVGSILHERRVGGPLGVPTPNLLELLHLVILLGDLEIFVHSFPGTVEGTDDPTIRWGVNGGSFVSSWSNMTHP